MTSEGSILTVPAPLRTFFSYFPLHTYPAIRPPVHPESAYNTPTLWVLPPSLSSDSDLLSADVECLKWQAYLALRGLTQVNVRWNIAPDGGIDGRLPCLHVPTGNFKDDSGEGELLAAHMIPGWTDSKVGEIDELEGYKDATCRDESRAWVALLEGHVHAALVSSSPH
jgi:metaxin